MPVRYKAVFVYAMNPRVLCNVERENIFMVRPLAGPFKGSDRSFNPKEHVLVNREELERAETLLDIFPQVGLV